MDNPSPTILQYVESEQAYPPPDDTDNSPWPIEYVPSNINGVLPDSVDAPLPSEYAPPPPEDAYSNIVDAPPPPEDAYSNIVDAPPPPDDTHSTTVGATTVDAPPPTEDAPHFPDNPSFFPFQ